jgi:hypothetical protein
LSGDGDRAHVIEARQFGVAKDQGGTQDERNQQNEYNYRHAMIGHRLPLSGRSMGAFGSVDGGKHAKSHV